MSDWNPFQMDELSWDVLKAYIKHGYGDFKIYNTTFFTYCLTDDTVCMTLNDLYEKAIDYDDNLWCQKSPLNKR